MRRIKFCGLGILVGIGVGIGVGQLMLAAMVHTGGLILARDIVGVTYGFPVVGAWVGYYAGSYLAENWKR